MQGLGQTSQVVMSGCSSGARGALYHLDEVCGSVGAATKCNGFHDGQMSAGFGVYACSLSAATWWADIDPLLVGEISLHNAIAAGVSLWNGTILLNKCGSLETLSPALFASCYFADNAIAYVLIVLHNHVTHVCWRGRFIDTPLVAHTEQYDAFQIPYDIGHGPPFNQTEAACVHATHVLSAV